MTSPDMLMLVVIVVGLGLFAYSVYDLLRRRRYQEQEATTLMLVAWRLSAIAALATVENDLDKGNARQNAESARDIIVADDELGAFIVGRGQEIDRLPSFMQNLFKVCALGYTRVEMMALSAEMQNGASISEMAAYLGAASSLGMAVSAFRSGVSVEYVGEL